MKYQKLLLPVLVIAIILIMGTSIALGVISFNRGADEDSPHGANPVEEQEPGLLPEQTPGEDTIPVDNGEDPENEDVDAEETDETEEKAPFPTPQTPPTPVIVSPRPVDAYMVAVTASALNVRPDPSSNNQPIDVLLQGQLVEVVAEMGNWRQVKLPDGRLGWVSGTHVIKAPASTGGKSLVGRVIVIDPGHGGKDPGAVGPTGLMEKEVNLDVSLRVVEKLRAAGARVIITRETDVFLPLSERVAIAEAARAEIFVSVHANAHPNRAIGGTETYYFGKKSTTNASISLAALLQRELVGALGLRDIGAKEASFHVIRNTTMPSALIELAFLSNAQEESLMRTNQFREDAANAIFRALQEYFK